MKRFLLLCGTFLLLTNAWSNVDCTYGFFLCLPDCPNEPVLVVNTSTNSSSSYDCNNLPNPTSACDNFFSWHLLELGGSNNPIQTYVTTDLTPLALPVSLFTPGVTYRIELYSVGGFIQVVQDFTLSMPEVVTGFLMNNSAASPLIICEGDPVAFTNQTSLINGNLFNHFHSWDFGDGNGSTQPNPTHTYAQVGTYVVNYEVITTFSNQSGTGTGFCIDTQNVVKNVVVIPREASFSTSAPVCVGDPVTFTNTSVCLPNASWNFGDGNGSTQYSPTHTYTNPGVYTVTLTGSDGPFSDVATQSVTVLPGTSFTINGLTDFCDPGQPLVTTHAASVTGIGISYQWTATGGTVTTNPNSNLATTTWGPTGGTLCCELTNADGCVSQECININVVAPASSCLNGATDLCAGLTQSYSACILAFNVTYTWDVTPDACSGQAPYQLNGPFATITWPPSGGTLCLTTSTLLNGTPCEEQTCVTVDPCCNLQLTVDTEDVCLGECEGTADLLINGGTAPYQIQWSTGATGGSQLTQLCPGTYNVTVTDAACCTAVQNFSINSVGSPQATLSHTASSTYPMLGGRRIYLWDIDQDNVLDLLSNGSGIRAQLGLGNGQFGTNFPTDAIDLTPANGGSEALAYADVNNDGQPDIISVSGGTIDVWINTSTPGTFNLTPLPAINLVAPGFISEPALFDFDGDNFPELAVANGATNEVYVYDNVAGVFTAPIVLSAPSTISYWEIKIVDVDGLNGPDIAFGVGGGSNDLHVFLNQGNGVFANGPGNERAYNTGAGTWPRGIQFAELDGQAGVEMIAAMQLTSELIVNVDLNNTNPVWARYPTGGQPVGIDVRDMNNDGHQDILVAVHTAPYFVRVFLNNAAGGFNSFIDFPGVFRPTDVMAGDLNGDCCIDFVTANQISNTTTVYLSACQDEAVYLSGNVFCEDNCGIGAPLAGANVNIVAQPSGTIYSVPTDNTGFYGQWLPLGGLSYDILLPAGNYATNCGSGPIIGYQPSSGSIPDILVADSCELQVNLIGSFAGNLTGQTCPFINTPCENFLWDYCVEFSNEGCSAIDVNVFELALPPNASPVLPLPDLTDCNTQSPIGSTISINPGNVLTWTLPTGSQMGSGECYTACVQVEFGSGFVLPVLATASANYTCDSLPSTAVDGVAYNDTCSCDPNYKLVFPAGCGDLGVVDNEPLTYTIHFSNIGQSPAFDVRIEDQLDGDLDWTTFQVIGSSHPVSQTSISPSGLLEVTYTGINLAPNAGAWFKYRIQPLANVPNQTTVTNDANIFFDSNPPVATNVVSNLIITAPLAINPTSTCETVYHGYEPMSCTDLSIYPSGGLAPYTVSWSTGETTNSIQVCPTTTTTYTVTVTDATGCSLTQEFTVHVINVVCGPRRSPRVLVCKISDLGEPIQLCLEPAQVVAHLEQGHHLGSCGTTDPCLNSRRRPATLNSLDDKATEWRLYPNPSRGLLYLEAQERLVADTPIQLRVYNAVGQVVYQAEYRGAQADQIILELEHQTPGLYLLQIEMADQLQVKKFVVE